MLLLIFPILLLFLPLSLFLLLSFFLFLLVYLFLYLLLFRFLLLVISVFFFISLPSSLYFYLCLKPNYDFVHIYIFFDSLFSDFYFSSSITHHQQNSFLCTLSAVHIQSETLSSGDCSRCCLCVECILRQQNRENSLWILSFVFWSEQ